MSHRNNPSRGGFTLIELMVVLAIIGTLALLVAPSVLRNVSDANLTAAKTQIEAFGVALDAYRLDTGAYPPTELGLAALRSRPIGDGSPAGWRGPYLRKNVPLDPWGRAYLFASPGLTNPDAYDLYTLGRDGLPGGDGEDVDITSWGGKLKS